MVTIRPFDANDLDRCADLYVRVFAEPPWNEAWTPKDARRHLEQAFATPGFTGLIAEDSGKLVGVVTGTARCGATGDYALLDDMFVDHGLRGQGIGRRLMDEMKQRLAKQGVIAIALFTKTGSHAADFYRTYGFEEDPHLRFMLLGLDS